jgi:hypothetical protein
MALMALMVLMAMTRKLMLMTKKMAKMAKKLEVIPRIKL